MKLRCERDVLVEALVTAGRAASRGEGPPVLSGVHLALRGDELHLAGTDYDLTMQVRVPVAGQQDGACVVPARLTSDIVRSLEPGAVVVQAQDDQVQISAGRSQFSVRTYHEEEFPRLAPPVSEGVVLAAAEFAQAMRQVVRAASGDAARATLTGVLLSAEEGGLRLVATDSYRLALRDLVGTSLLPEGNAVLVPARALAELQRLLTSSSLAAEAARALRFRIGEHDAVFEVGPVTLTTRLLGLEFPNYRQLIPASYPNRLVVNKEALIDAVRRVKLLVRDTASAVKMAMGPDGIELSASDPERGQASEDVDAKYEGTELTVAFNPTYLIEGVEAVVGDEVLIETMDAAKPAMLRASEADSYRYLLMPVRVS